MNTIIYERENKMTNFQQSSEYCRQQHASFLWLTTEPLLGPQMVIGSRFRVQKSQANETDE